MAQPLKPQRLRARSTKTSKTPAVKAKSRLGPVAPTDVELVRSVGSRKRGGGPGGEAWIVMAEGKRAGTAYINVVSDDIRGVHASFHIFLNRPSQGRLIGRIAYRLCCEASSHGVIYAHMRKSNIASRAAAMHARFTDATAADDSQLVLVWRRDQVISPVNITGDVMTDRASTAGPVSTGAACTQQTGQLSGLR